jgi:hypothetical protein
MQISLKGEACSISKYETFTQTIHEFIRTRNLLYKTYVNIHGFPIFFHSLPGHPIALNSVHSYHSKTMV